MTLFSRWFTKNYRIDHPTWLPAYVLWRMNGHPFGGGEWPGLAGVLLPAGMRQGRLLPGKRLVPERISAIPAVLRGAAGGG